MDNAAHNLLGMTLPSRWYVKEKIEKGDNQTGSFFSVCYLVEKDGITSFLKAYDIMKFNSIKLNGQTMMDVMSDMTTAYKYERDLSEYCKGKNVTKVSFVTESGEVHLPEYTWSIVPYLIFDLADGDVRKQLQISDDLDYAWRLKSLHDIAIGLKQLHKIEVSHQDLKPSNILVFESDSKIGDLGRSMCKDLDGPYNKQLYTGDVSYAPPELLYGYFEKDWLKRVFATDCYLLGSLIVFYFSGVSMSVLLKKHLPENFWWDRWKGSYKELIPYLENAFIKALEDFDSNIVRPDLRNDLVVLVKYLCYPFPEKRGHPKNIASSVGSNFNMERVITSLDLLKKRAERKFKH